MYHTQSNSFSMLFSMPPTNGDGEMYSAAAASVDCTLSLGTPSTRGDNNHRHRESAKRPSYMSGFGWNILPSTPTPPPPAATKTHRGGGGGDPLLARRCANCDTTSTPLWRNGPRGPKSLCNACGIRFKKEERRATAAAAHVEVQAQKSACYPSAYGNEFRFMEDDVVGDHHRDSESGGMQFLSWRFNVAGSRA